MDIKLLSFPSDSPPLSVIVAAKFAGITSPADSSLASGSAPTFLFANGLKLHGTSVLLRYIGRVTNIPNFYGQNAYESSQGASKNLNLMEWDKLWTINKKIIDPVCPRHTAVVEDRRVLFTLDNGPEKPFIRVIPKHKKYEGAGEKSSTFTKSIWIDQVDAQCIKVDEEITLMDWGNAIVKGMKKDQDGYVTQLSGILHLEGSVKTTKLKATWLPDINELVTLSLMEFDYLITKKKLEEGEDFLDVLNPCTKKETIAVGDSNMRNLKRGDILQLERKGYFRCDVPYVRPSKPIVLFAIPDGRQQSCLK